MSVDPRSDRPVYQQIADVLRERIVGGQYPPGSKLPSETELIEEYDVSRLTVRRALAVLMVEGRTESKRGVGVYVREAQPVLRMGNSRFSRADRAAGKGALAAEAERLGLDWDQEVLELTIVDAPPAVREVLGEARVVVKRRRMIVAGKPTQLAASYLPESVATAIKYEECATAPGGVYRLLEEHGHVITRFRESITVRAASPEEAVALGINNAAPVAALVRVAFDQHGRAVEYFDSVAVGDRHVYVYEFDAPKE
jgi:GntR family transcriptional regulator